MGCWKVFFLFELCDDHEGHFCLLPVCPSVQQVVEEFEEPPASGLHLLVTFFGCRTPIGLLLFM